MKTNLLTKCLMLTLPLFSVKAFAVTVKDCPKFVKVTVTSPNVTILQKDVLEQVEHDITDEKIAAVKGALVTIANTDEFERYFNLSKAANGRCSYEESSGDEKVEIYTSKGKSMLMLQTQAGSFGILLRTYANIESISPTEVKLSKPSAGIALAIPRGSYDNYNAGGALIFIGNAAKVEVATDL